MRRATVAMLLALAVGGSVPADALVDIDEYKVFTGTFPNGTDCVWVRAYWATYPNADTGGIVAPRDFYVEARLYQNGGSCSGLSRYWRADLDENEGASVFMDQAASSAVIVATIDDPDDGTMNLAVTFASDEVPDLDPFARLTPTVLTYDSYRRDGAAMGSFSSPQLSVTGVQSNDAAVYSWYRVELG